MYVHLCQTIINAVGDIERRTYLHPPGDVRFDEIVQWQPSPDKQEMGTSRTTISPISESKPAISNLQPTLFDCLYCEKMFASNALRKQHTFAAHIKEKLADAKKEQKKRQRKQNLYEYDVTSKYCEVCGDDKCVTAMYGASTCLSYVVFLRILCKLVNCFLILLQMSQLFQEHHRP
jgi:hypothetical protein